MDYYGSLACYYACLVLLPQVVWFLLSSDGRLFASCCDSFTLLHTPKDSDPSPDTADAGKCYAKSEVDNVTAKLCSCSVTPDDMVEDFELELLEQDGLGGWCVCTCSNDGCSFFGVL